MVLVLMYVISRKLVEGKKNGIPNCFGTENSIINYKTTTTIFVDRTAEQNSEPPTPYTATYIGRSLRIPGYGRKDVVV